MRIGVIGLRRGLQLAGWCRRLGIEVAAACDLDPERRKAARREVPGAVRTARCEDLLDQRLDGVILANDSTRTRRWPPPFWSGAYMCCPSARPA